MELSLKNRDWKEFLINEIFIVENSKAYHKTNLKELKANGIPYISRTNNNNGLDAIVKKGNYKENEANTIVFGAENATFFYQPFKYITGNKMYTIKSEKINKYSGQFIQNLLNVSIKDCGFGYGKGLTGTRLNNRYIKLPINSKGNPDYEFMENYMRAKEQEKTNAYKNYISKRISQIENSKEVVPLTEKEWAEFFIEDIADINSGRDIYKEERTKGNIPYVTSTALNNGIGYFVGNNNDTLEKGCLSVNRNGSVGYSFYHDYEALYSNDCRKLRLKYPSRHVGIFISQQITKQKEKYGYGYKMGTARIKRQKIMLPINDNHEPDYEYMENYMKQLELKKLKKYLEYKTIEK